MRQVGYHLHHLPEMPGAHLVKRQGERHRKREKQHNFHETDHQRVFDNIVKGRRGKQRLKMLPPYENIVPHNSVVVKGKSHLKNGPHMKYQKI